MATTPASLDGTSTAALGNGSGSSNATLAGAVDDESLPPRMAFLSLFIVTALFGNTFVVVVVLQSPARRRSSLHVIILNLSVVCLLDSLLNMSLVLGALATNSWMYGDFVCKCNTFMMNCVLTETILSLLLLSLDRLVAVKAQAAYDRAFTRLKVSLLLGYTWLHSVAFSLPLLTGALSSTFQAQLHLCAISGSASLVFVCLTSVLCVLLPVIATVVFHILTIRAAYTQRFAVRTILAQNHYSEKFSPPPRILQESFMAKYAGILFIIWLILDLPYIVTVYIQQYQVSSEFQSNPILGQVEYPWVVDVTLTWTRFAFSAVAPVFTFFWSKEYWQSVKDAILCRRKNSVVDVQASLKPGKARSKERKTDLGATGAKDRRNEGQNMSFSVPVLFATANGIHIQTSEPEESEGQTVAEDDADPPEIAPRGQVPSARLRGRKCDVTGLPADYLAADTSDYDSSSEMDPYSSSQPISARDVVRPDVQRSSSQPEVKRDRGEAGADSALKNLVQLCGTDSGLDLSASTSVTLLSRHSGGFGSTGRARATARGQRQPLACSALSSANGTTDSVLLDSKSSPCGGTPSGSPSTCGEVPCPSLCVQCVVSTADSQSGTKSSVLTCESRDTDRAKPCDSGSRADSSNKHEVLAIAEINPTQIPPAQKPPIRLKPIDSPSRASLKGKKERSPKKQTHTSRQDGGDRGKDQHQPGSEGGVTRRPSRRRSHKRRGTADSQKALMGSGSSSELQELPVQCQRDSRTSLPSGSPSLEHVRLAIQPP